MFFKRSSEQRKHCLKSESVSEIILLLWYSEMKHYSLLHRFYCYIFSSSIHQLFNYISEIQNKEMASSWNSSLNFIQSYHFLSKFLQVNPLIADDRNSIQASSSHSENSDWAVVAMVNLIAEGESIKNIARKAYTEEENYSSGYI